MNVDLNTFFRTKTNEASLTYKGEDLAVVFPLDTYDGSGAYVNTLLFTTNPESSEIGYGAQQNSSGYYQFVFFVPASDNGLDYALNNFADQLIPAFPRQSYAESFGKVMIDSVERLSPLIIDGKGSITCRVHFRLIG